MVHRRFAVLLMAVALASSAFAQSKAESATNALSADPGVLVVAVQQGSPAEKAGLVRGDIILEANGQAVNDARQLRQALTGTAAGAAVAFKVRHGDAQKTLTVTVGTQNGRPWIGILPLPGRGDEMAFGGPGIPTPGALVEGVASASPAEKAGIKPGDVILSVNGTAVDQKNTLSDLVATRKVGETITLAVRPQGQNSAHDVKATLEKNPGSEAAWLGLQYVTAPAGFARPGMMPGAFVVQVTADSPAAKAGIQDRDIVTRIDGTAVKTPQDIVDAVGKHKPGDTLAVTVFRRADGRESDLTVTLGPSPNDATKAWLGVSLGGPGAGFRTGRPGEL